MSVDEDDDAVGGEGLVVTLAGAGGYGCGVGGGVGELLEDGGGDLGEVGSVPLNDEGGVAGVAGVHGAGGAGVGVGGSGCETVVSEELGDAAFYLAGGEGGGDAGEVLHGVEEAVVLDDSDAGDVEAGIEDVGAVGGGVHPGLEDLGGCGAVAGDVLGDAVEVGSGLGGSGEEVGLAGVLVSEGGGFAGCMLDDELGVEEGGAGEDGIPGEGREVVLGAALVGQVKEGLLGSGLGVGNGSQQGRNEEDGEGCTQFIWLLLIPAY